MAHDTVPSAPALPVLRAPADKTPPPDGNLPTELRVIVEEFRRLRGRLVAGVVPGDPPHWRAGGGDPFVVLETNKANRLLREGRTVEFAAGALAFGLIARTFGVHAATEATRLLRARG